MADHKKTVFESLQTASYAGYEFLYDNESETGGKNVVIHRYPNSDKIYIEEFGVNPPEFSMNAIIHGNINDRISFVNNINQKGSHVLVHPIYGTIENVVVTNYTTGFNLKEVGIFRFTIDFKITNPLPIAPNVKKKDVNLISSGAIDSRESLFDNLKDKYIPPGSIDAYTAVKDQVVGVVNTVKDSITKITTPINDAVAEFNKVSNYILSNVDAIIQTGEGLKNTFLSLYSSVLNIVDIPSKLESYWDSLVNFGKEYNSSTSSYDEPSSANLKSDTQKRDEIKINATIIDESVRLNAVISLNEAIAYKDDNTVREINDNKEYLNYIYNENINEIFDYFEDDEDQDILLVNDPTLRSIITTLRNNTSIILNEKIVNAWRIVNVRTNPISFSLISYKYYESLDNIDTLITVNKNLNVSGFKENVNILSN